MVDFTDVLGKKASEVQKPVPKPIGTYLSRITGLPKQKLVKPRDGGDDMPVMSFTVKRIMAQSDVDADQLSEAEEKAPIAEWPPVQVDFFIHTESGQNAYKTWMTHVLGIESGEGTNNEKSLGEMTAETPGKQFLLKMKLEPFTDREGKPDIGERPDSMAHV